MQKDNSPAIFNLEHFYQDIGTAHQRTNLVFNVGLENLPAHNSMNNIKYYLVSL